MATTTQDQPTAQLLGGLLGDARELVEAHVDQLRFELRDELSTLGRTLRRGAVLIVVAVIVGVLLAQALVFGLRAATPLPLWACFGVVGALISGAAAASMRSRGRTPPPPPAAAAP